MRRYSIYSIRNKLNGKRYIGLSYKPLKRMEQHRKSIYPIGKAIRKYGWDNFDKRILKIGLTLNQAQKAERFYIAKYKSLGRGYNLCGGGEGLFNPTKELRKRMGNKKGCKFSKEARKKMSLSAKGNKCASGKRSKETCQNISKAQKNRPKEVYAKGWKTRRKNGNDKHSKESRKKMSRSNRVRAWTEKSKRKQSKSMVGNQNSLGCIRSSKWVASRRQSMKNNNPAKQPKTKLKMSKMYLAKAKQRLIESTNLPQCKINVINRQIARIKTNIKELKILIRNN